MMDITILPSKKVLLFYDEVYPWVERVVLITDTKQILAFKKETPQKIIDLFDKLIKAPELNGYERV
ncbi:hypothetical protein NHG33_08530 [Aerococcaceae bacterium NML130460]|nr:hypothetical protein [Aerococcaceae bacterium NML130460]